MKITKNKTGQGAVALTPSECVRLSPGKLPSPVGVWRWWNDTSRENLPTLEWRRFGRQPVRVDCPSFADFHRRIKALECCGFVEQRMAADLLAGRLAKLEAFLKGLVKDGRESIWREEWIEVKRKASKVLGS